MRVPRSRSRSTGFSRPYACASSSLSALACTIATCWSLPSSTRSTMHQSARSGTARCASCSSVARKARVAVPALVVTIDVTGGIGHPCERGDVVGECPYLPLALGELRGCLLSLLAKDVLQDRDRRARDHGGEDALILDRKRIGVE